MLDSISQFAQGAHGGRPHGWKQLHGRNPHGREDSMTPSPTAVASQYGATLYFSGQSQDGFLKMTPTNRFTDVGGSAASLAGHPVHGASFFRFHSQNPHLNHTIGQLPALKTLPQVAIRFGDTVSDVPLVSVVPKNLEDEAEKWPLGATYSKKETTFRVWAPRTHGVNLVLIDLPRVSESKKQEILNLDPDQQLIQLKALMENHIKKVEMASDEVHNNHFLKFPLKTTDGTELKVNPGQLYMLELKFKDGDREWTELLPDFASRYQPFDVHGPSMVVDPTFDWKHDNQWGWRRLDTQNGIVGVEDNRRSAVYNLHLGTFTPEGTIQSAMAKLPYIQEMGFDTLYLNPVNEFPGRRNWGYDMASLRTLESSYGSPEDFRRFVDRAHELGLKVVIDMVFNHTGPEGTYYNRFDSGFVVEQAGVTPWGNKFNWNNPHVVEYMKKTLGLWAKEYHVDGFRFDMAQYVDFYYWKQMLDYLHGELAEELGSGKRNPRYLKVIMEDPEVKNNLTASRRNGGIGVHGKYSFQYHHHSRSFAQQRSHEEGPTQLIHWINTISRGNKFNDQGQVVDLNSQFIFSESHDEIGNHWGFRMRTPNDASVQGRPIPQEIRQGIGRDRALLTSLVKYLVPGYPMNFMGEEYGATTPFYYFTDLRDRAAIRGNIQGRTNDAGFADRYPDFMANPGRDPKLPEHDRHDGWQSNPQQRVAGLNLNPYHSFAFQSSKLDWRQEDPYVKAVTKQIIELRKTVPALWQGGRNELAIFKEYAENGGNSLVFYRRGTDNPDDAVLVVMNFTERDFNNSNNDPFELYFPDAPEFEWKEVFNTDAPTLPGQKSKAKPSINGDTCFPSNGEKQKIQVPPYGLVIFRQQKKKP